MTTQEKLRIFNQVEKDAIKKTLDVDPTSTEFGRLLDNLANLRATIAYYTRIEGSYTDARDDEPVDAPKAEVEPKDAVAPKGETPPPCEPAPIPVEQTHTKAEVLAKLKEARKAGVNVADIIRSFGVDNFGDIDPGKYPAVLDALKAEGGN